MKHLLAPFICCVLLSLTGRTQADDDRLTDLGIVEITATKQSTALQETPLSIAVLDGETLTAAGVNNIREAAAYVPNLFISGLTARRTSFPFIRGIGSGQGDPVVTTYIDGVPQLTPNTTDLELLGLERIEVLRGPQGTLYGRNTVGGVINIVTSPPERLAAFDTRLTVGGYDLQRLDFRWHGPVGDESALGLAGSVSERDGYTDNLATGNDVDYRQTAYGRVQLRWQPEADFEVNLAVHLQRDNDGDFTLYDLASRRQAPHQIRRDFDGFTDRELVIPSLRIDYRVADYEVVSITSLQHWQATDASDVDFTEAAQIPAAFGFSELRRHTEEQQDQLFQELRLGSAEDADGIRWLFGAALSLSRFDHNSVTETFLAPTFALDDTTAYRLDDLGIGVFGRGTVALTDRLELSLGLRYEYQRTDVQYQQVAATLATARTGSFNEDFGELLPRADLSLRITDHLTAYTSAARGFRAGGFNRNLHPVGPDRFQEENSWTYEIGAHSRWFGDRLQLNGALFYIDWQDMQLDVQTGAASRFALDNVGDARSRGFELEATAELMPQIELFAGIGVVDAEFRDGYIEPATSQNVAGNDLPNVPAYNWHLGLQAQRALSRGLTAFARAEVIGVGEYAFDSTNAAAATQSAYELVNLRLGLAYGQWQLTGWLRNAFDEPYVVAAVRDYTLVNFAGTAGAPRQGGVTLQVSF